MQVCADGENTRPSMHVCCVLQCGHAARYLLRDLLDKTGVSVLFEVVRVNTRLHRSTANQGQAGTIRAIVNIEHTIDVRHMVSLSITWALQYGYLVANIPHGKLQPQLLQQFHCPSAGRASNCACLYHPFGGLYSQDSFSLRKKTLHFHLLAQLHPSLTSSV